MRRIILFLVLGGFFSFHTYAQWVVQTAPVTFEARGINMTSSQTGYIVGSDGNMLKTTDAGSSWASLPTGITDTLRSLYFVDENNGYIVGAHGTIRKTTDGGLSWVSQTSGVTNLLRSVYFVSSTVGYVCGGGGMILKTTNGGTTWVVQSSGTTQDLINIRFSDANTGYVTSSLSTFTNGLILKTTDGGDTWTTVYTNTNGLLGLAVFGDVIYAGGGYQTIVKSSDAGANWTTVNPATTTANHFRRAAFVTATKGYVVGDLGMIYYTNNGGVTWSDQVVNTLGVLSVFVVNPDTIFACGTTSNILRYTPSCLPEQPGLINGSNSVCKFDTVTYAISSVPGTLYYKWQVPDNSTILSGQGDTLITVHIGIFSGVVVVSDSNDCGISLSSQMNVTANPLPATPWITQNFTTLMSTSTGGNQWYLNGNLIVGATSQTYTFSQNGTYTVKVTLSTGCSAISAPYNVTNTGISENQAMLSQITVMPNPAQQQASLNFQLKETASVAGSVYDILGKKVLDLAPIKLSAGTHQIALDCMFFEKGIYLVKLLVNDNVHFVKFLKE